MYSNDKKSLDNAVKDVIKNPEIGEQKKGDLAWLRVYKYKMGNHQYLLGYEYDEQGQTITLSALGSHENFYRDIR